MRRLRSLGPAPAGDTHRARAALLLALAASMSVACSDAAPPVAPGPARPMADIVDGAHGGNGHFYFLRPLVGAPTFTGTFDPAVEPIVEICELAGESCAAVIAPTAFERQLAPPHSFTNRDAASLDAPGGLDASHGPLTHEDRRVEATSPRSAVTSR